MACRALDLEAGRVDHVMKSPGAKYVEKHSVVPRGKEARFPCGDEAANGLAAVFLQLRGRAAVLLEHEALEWEHPPDVVPDRFALGEFV